MLGKMQDASISLHLTTALLILAVVEEGVEIQTPRPFRPLHLNHSAEMSLLISAKWQFKARSQRPQELLGLN